MKYYLWFRYAGCEPRKSPYPIEARNQAEADELGRQLITMAGGLNEGDKTDLGIPVQLYNALLLLPTFIKAEAEDGGQSERKGMCEHNVRAKYCRACVVKQKKQEFLDILAGKVSPYP